MITDAYVRVVCDECHAEEEVQLAATSRGWDDRGVNEDIESWGWKIDGDAHHCANCAAGDEEDA